TGFGSADYSTSAKWLELLKEIAPEVARVAVLYHPRNPGGLPMFTAIQVIAPMLRVEVSPAAVRDAAEIERAVAALPRSPNGGLIMTRTAEVMAHHDLASPSSRSPCSATPSTLISTASPKTSTRRARPRRRWLTCGGRCLCHCSRLVSVDHDAVDAHGLV